MHYTILQHTMLQHDTAYSRRRAGTLDAFFFLPPSFTSRLTTNWRTSSCDRADLRTKILDLKRHFNFKGWNSHVHRESPGKFESTHLSRDNLSREIGCSRAEQSRAEQSRAEQSRAEQSRAEQSRAEPSRS